MLRYFLTASLLLGATTTLAFQTPFASSIKHRSLIPSPLSLKNHAQLTNNLSTPSVTKPKSTRRMAVEGDFDPEMISRDVSLAQSGSLKGKLKAIYKFTRPHTIRGTILASIAGTIRALRDTPTFSFATANWSVMLPRAFIGMVALLLGNAFIVGINQIYDVAIDKLNKPFLPVASGEMSKRFAWISVLTAGTLGPVIV